jgi:hypothetical protein
MPERHADLLEVGFGQVRQNLRIDLMLAEERFVLSEANRVQPLADVHVGAAYAETGTSSSRRGMESRISEMLGRLSRARTRSSSIGRPRGEPSWLICDNDLSMG